MWLVIVMMRHRTLIPCPALLRVAIMAMVVATADGVDRPAQLRLGNLSCVTVGQTQLLVTASGHGTFVWELRRWYYRDAMAPPEKRLYHRIRTSQKARGGLRTHGSVFTGIAHVPHKQKPRSLSLALHVTSAMQLTTTSANTCSCPPAGMAQCPWGALPRGAGLSGHGTPPCLPAKLQHGNVPHPFAGVQQCCVFVCLTGGSCVWRFGVWL